MRVNFCGFAGIVSQQNLDRSQICSCFKQMVAKLWRRVCGVTFFFISIKQKGIEKALIVQKQDYFDNYLQNPWPALK
jgi:hypothetical protein